MPRTRLRAPVLLLVLHGLLGLWALDAWMAGPYGGAAILDGAEVLDRALAGGQVSVFATKSPLYPEVLGLFLRAGFSQPWTIGLLGLLCSLATLQAIGVLCRQLGQPRAVPWAMGAYVLAAGPVAFLVQPLPVVSATALLAWGTVALMGVGRGRVAMGGALLGAAVFARASLLVPVAALLAWQVVRRRGLTAVLGALSVAVVCVLSFGERAWPTGAALNLRLGNGAARTGISDVRPGPAYDRLRSEPVFAAWQAGAGAVSTAAYHRARLAEELAADPAGAAATLARKAYLFWHRAEIHTGADFVHGLRGLAPLPLLLLGFGLLAPLALMGLARLRHPALWLPVAGVFAVNVVFLTGARYRLPALPFLCVAAGTFIVSRPDRRQLVGAAALAVVLNVNLTGLDLGFPGDGWALQGRHLLGTGRVAESIEPLQRAVDLGRDPRARYDLALACEHRAAETGGEVWLDRAEQHYREALDLDALYPQAGENLMSLLLRRGRKQEAEVLGGRLVAGNPYAGLARLNLANLRTESGQDERARALLADGHRIMALRLLAQNERAGAAFHATELHRLGVDDPVLDALLTNPPSDGAGRASGPSSFPDP